MQSDCKLDLPFQVTPTGKWRMGILDAPDLFCAEGNVRHITEKLKANGYTVSPTERGTPYKIWAEKGGERVCLYCYAFNSLGAALLDSTGTFPFLIFMRTVAKKQYLKLRRDGVYRMDTKIHGRTEEGIFQALSIPYIPPEERNLDHRYKEWPLWKNPRFAWLKRYLRFNESRRKTK